MMIDTKFTRLVAEVKNKVLVFVGRNGIEQRQKTVFHFL